MCNIVYYTHNDHRILFIYVDDNSEVLIIAVVGVDCTIIIIMVIINIMIWIYCFRKRHHTGTLCKPTL